MPAVLTVSPELVDRDRQPWAAHVASTIQCVGISHHTASVSLRERLALCAAEAASILARFGCGIGARPHGVSELVILSTCNRLELYASGGSATNDALVALLEETTTV